MQIYLEGIGLRGPGLDGWTAGIEMLTGRTPYVPGPLVVPASELLPATERRRTVPAVKLALAVASEAFAQAGRDAAQTVTTFSASGGDGETVHQILAALARPERDISPTRFHNSVHNAPSGYWTIAVHSYEPATTLCGHDASFTVGLLDVAAQVTVDRRAVALIAYDLPYPEPLGAARPMMAGFGAALVLAPEETERTLARLSVALVADAGPPTPMRDPAFEALRRGNPAARSLPLLAALARGREESVALEHIAGKCVTVDVQVLSRAPC